MRIIFLSALATWLLFSGCASQNPQPSFNDQAYVKNRLQLADEQEHSYWIIMSNYDKKKQVIMEQYKPKMPQMPRGGARPMDFQKPPSLPSQDELKEKFQFLRNELEILNKETAEHLKDSTDRGTNTGMV